jgi:hypothetical protein
MGQLRIRAQPRGAESTLASNPESPVPGFDERSTEAEVSLVERLTQPSFPPHRSRTRPPLTPLDFQVTVIFSSRAT